MDMGWRVWQSIRILSRGRCGGKKAECRGNKGRFTTTRGVPVVGVRRAPEQKTAGLVKRVINVYGARLPNSRPETPSRGPRSGRGCDDRPTLRLPISPPPFPDNGGRGRNFQFFTPVADVSPSFRFGNGQTDRTPRILSENDDDPFFRRRPHTTFRIPLRACLGYPGRPERAQPDSK